MKNDIDLIHVCRRIVKEIYSRPFFIVYFKVCPGTTEDKPFWNLILELKMADHFLHCVLRSARKFDFGTEDGPFLMLCFKVRSSIIINVRITEGGPFLMLSFRICHLIIYLRITEGGPFLMLCFKVLPVISHVRNTEGRAFLMPCFEVRPVI